MALRKKERVLTPEELKAKFKRDYAPFWINSEVIFGANLYPVSDSFTKQATLLFLLDAADFTTEKVTDLLYSWKQKYGKLQWESVLIFQPKYTFLKNPKFFDRFKNQKIFLDTFGELFERFGSNQEPVAVMLKNGEMVASIPLSPDFSEASLQLEQQLQKSLRQDDPGLPLAIVEKWNKKMYAKQQSVTPEGVSTFGEWNGSKTLLVTEKNGSILSLPFKGKILRLVAMAHPEARDPIKVSITLNERPLPSTLQPSFMHGDDTGATLFELNKTTGIYDLFHSENEITGVIKLTFLNVYDNGAVFYEFKIAS